MNVGTPFIWAIILVLLSPGIWIAWWLLADLASLAGGSHEEARHESAERSLKRAA